MFSSYTVALFCGCIISLRGGLKRCYKSNSRDVLSIGFFKTQYFGYERVHVLVYVLLFKLEASPPNRFISIAIEMKLNLSESDRG